MRFRSRGYWENPTCEECQRKISHLDDQGFEDQTRCSGCSARGQQAWDKIPCEFCKKPMNKEKNWWFHLEGDVWSHDQCYQENKSKINEEDLEMWVDEIPF